MKSTMLLSLAVCFFAANSVFGQSSRIASQPCCGQTTSQVNLLSPEEEILATRLAIQGRLLSSSSTSSLKLGVYVISTSPDGHKFQATVNSRGAVSNWFVSDPSGLRIAQVNSNDGGGKVDVNRCMDAFVQRAEFCEWQGTFDSRYNYGRCYWEAWIAFLSCLDQQAASGTIMR